MNPLEFKIPNYEILIKKIDEYKSSKFKGKTTPEYAIYLMVGITPIECYTTIGNENKEIIKLGIINRFGSINVNEK